MVVSTSTRIFQILSYVKGLLYLYSLLISLPLLFLPCFSSLFPFPFCFTAFSLYLLFQSPCNLSTYSLPKPWFIYDNLCNSFSFILILPVLLYYFWIWMTKFGTAGLPRWLIYGKESAGNGGDMSSIPQSWRFPGESSNPLQYPWLVNL